MPEPALALRLCASPPAEAALSRPLEPADDGGTAALARRAQRGDRSAFGALYERHASHVHGVLLSLVPPGEAQDLVQEVFLLALRGLGALEDPARFGPWIAAIARNRGKDALRARGRDGRASGKDDSELGEPGACDVNRRDGADAAGDEEAARVLATVRLLPEAYRETLILRLVEGLSGRDIAARTGMTHGSVRVNLCRGMKLLRERLGSREGASARASVRDRRPADGA